MKKTFLLMSCLLLVGITSCGNKGGNTEPVKKDTVAYALEEAKKLEADTMSKEKYTLNAIVSPTMFPLATDANLVYDFEIVDKVGEESLYVSYADCSKFGMPKFNATITITGYLEHVVVEKEHYYCISYGEVTALSDYVEHDPTMDEEKVITDICMELWGSAILDYDYFIDDSDGAYYTSAYLPDDITDLLDAIDYLVSFLPEYITIEYNEPTLYEEDYYADYCNEEQSIFVEVWAYIYEGMYCGDICVYNFENFMMLE